MMAANILKNPKSRYRDNSLTMYLGYLLQRRVEAMTSPVHLSTLSKPLNDTERRTAADARLDDDDDDGGCGGGGGACGGGDGTTGSSCCCCCSENSLVAALP